MENKARLESTSDGIGNAGSIVVSASDSISVKNSNVETQAIQSNGGDLTIISGKSIILRDGEITSSAGLNGGNITIISANEIIMDSRSQITAQAENDGGDIEIRASSFIHFTDSVVTAQAENNGGNISIDPEFLFLNAAAFWLRLLMAMAATSVLRLVFSSLRRVRSMHLQISELMGISRSFLRNRISLEV